MNCSVVSDEPRPFEHCFSYSVQKRDCYKPYHQLIRIGTFDCSKLFGVVRRLLRFSCVDYTAGVSSSPALCPMDHIPGMSRGTGIEVVFCRLMTDHRKEISAIDF